LTTTLTKKGESLDLGLHRKQLQIFSDRSRVKVVCAGRGFGKSILLLVTALHVCLGYAGTINPISPQTALIVMPTLKMARGIHWLPLLNLAEKIPAVKRVDKSDFRIQFHGDRPDLILRGADYGGDKLRGLNLIWAGLDEYQDFHHEVWEKALYPALSRNADWSALVIGTPKGKQSHFYEFHERAISSPDWSYYHAITADNPYIRRREIRRAKRQLPPKTYRQEFEASWENFDGQIFDQLQETHKLQATDLPSSYQQVLIGVDWGDINPAVVAIGVQDQQYYLLSAWHNEAGIPTTEDDLKDRVQKLCDRFSAYRCYLPDDRPASVLAFRRWGKAKGCMGMRRSIQVKRGQPGVVERGMIINSLLYQDRLFFAPECHHLYDKFGSYHRGKDGQGNLLPKPAGQQDDHEIDATAYVIGQLEGNLINPQPQTA
jgi:hypothetical protein